MIKAAVLGSPISHSLSPVLHRAAYRFLNLTGTYSAVDVEQERLQEFMENLDDSWTGFSLTMPLKEKVLQFAGDIEPLARSISSANTLIRTENGWKALTTDVNGFRSSLAAHGVEDFSSVTILGAGATARAAACAVDAPGRVITIINRSSRAEFAMSQAAPNSSITFVPSDFPFLDADLLINTTPRGVADDFAMQQLKSFRGVLFEALYDPWPTLLLSESKSRGISCIDGLDLLVHQAIDQVALMTHFAMVREDLAPIMRQAGLDELLGRAASIR